MQVIKNAKKAFDGQKYNQALALYLKIDRKASSYTSRYNLAVCYYKLEYWQEAYSIFSRLHESDERDERVQLNLALTEVKRKNIDVGLDHLFYLSNFAESDVIATLAYRNYKKINEKYGKNKPIEKINFAKWLLNAGVSVGSDDNVVSLADETASTTSDTFIESSLAATWYSSTDFNHNWLFDVNIFTSRYVDASDYDIDVIAAGGKKYTSFKKGQRLHLGLRFDQSKVGGVEYLKSTYLTLGNRHILNTSSVLKYGLRYQYTTESIDRFKPFAGTGLRIYSRWAKQIGAHHWVLRYRYDNESKNDTDNLLILDENFISYSSIRHSIYGAWIFEHGNWRTQFDVSYRDSKYKDPHVFRNNTTDMNDDISEKRNDARFTIGAQLSRYLSNNWSIDFNFRELNNRSNLDQYDYDQSVISVALNWQN